MKNNAERVLHSITEEDIQQRALETIDRELTEDEVQKVRDKIILNYWRVHEMIDESIEEVTAFDDLQVRNSCAEMTPVHYLLYWKNKNAWQKEYTLVFASFTEDDAREYAKHSNQPYDQHKIVLINNGVEKVIEEMGEEYPDDCVPPSKEDWVLIDKNIKLLDF